jgi:hypothetical protein
MCVSRAYLIQSRFIQSGVEPPHSIYKMRSLEDGEFCRKATWDWRE